MTKRFVDQALCTPVQLRFKDESWLLGIDNLRTLDVSDLPKKKYSSSMGVRLWPRQFLGRVGANFFCKVCGGPALCKKHEKPSFCSLQCKVGLGTPGCSAVLANPWGLSCFRLAVCPVHFSLSILAWPIGRPTGSNSEPLRVSLHLGKQLVHCGF